MRRSAGWKITFGLAAVAIVAFVAFDVLDLDGSQVRAQTAECALVEGASVAVERLASSQSAPDVLSPLLPRPSPSLGSMTSWLTRQALRAPARSSAMGVQRRGRSSLIAPHASPSSSDPV
jgi:hypothetical protein